MQQELPKLFCKQTLAPHGNVPPLVTSVVVVVTTAVILFVLYNFLVMVFLTTYWFVIGRNKKPTVQEAPQVKKKNSPTPTHSRHHPSRA